MTLLSPSSAPTNGVCIHGSPQILVPAVLSLCKFVYSFILNLYVIELLKPNYFFYRLFNEWEVSLLIQ